MVTALQRLQQANEPGPGDNTQPAPKQTFNSPFGGGPARQYKIPLPVYHSPEFAKTTHNIPLASIVPSTGEQFGTWLSRRLSTVTAQLPSFGPKFALELASAPVSDQELSGVIQTVQHAARHYPVVPPAPTTQQQLDAAAAAVYVGGPAAGPASNTANLISPQGPSLSALGAVRSYEKYQALLKQEENRVKLHLAKGDIAGALNPNVVVPVAPPQAGPGQGVNLPDPSAAVSAIQSKIQNMTPTHAANYVATLNLQAAAQAAIPTGLKLISGVGQTLESAYHVVSRPLATAFQIAFPATPLGTAEGLLGAAGIGPKPNFVTPHQAFNNSAMGPGRALATEGGLAPGSAPFKLASGAIDFVFRNTVDPVVLAAEAGQGLRLAARIPIGEAESIGESGLKGAVFKFFGKTPEQLLETGRGSRFVDSAFTDFSGVPVQQLNLVRPEGELGQLTLTETSQRTANLAKLADKYNIPGALTPALFDAAQEGKAAFKQAITDAMTGRPIAYTREKWVLALEQTKSTIAEFEANGVKEEFLRPLQKQASSLEDLISGDKKVPQDIIRELPKDTFLTSLKTALKHPEDSGRLGKFLGWLTDSDWSRKFLPATGKLPSGGISLTDLSAGRENLQRVGRLLGLPRAETDLYVSQYLKATSFQEARDAYLNILRAGGQKLPERLGSELTQLTDAPLNSIYAVGNDGQALTSWQKEVPVEGGVLKYNQPILVTQLAQEMPLPDIRGIIEARSWRGRLTSWLKGETFPRPSIRMATLGLGGSPLGTLLGKGLDATHSVMTFLTSSVWTPSVLLRLGWPLRVLPEEMLRFLGAGINPLEYSPLNVLAHAGADSIEVPEQTLMHMGRLFYDSRPVQGLIAREGKGYTDAVAEQLVRFNNDPVMRYLAANGPDETLSWLTTGSGEEYAKQMSRVISGTGGTVEDWVKVQQEALNGLVGNSERLKQAVATGKLPGALGDINIHDAGQAAMSRASEELKLYPNSELPLTAKMTGDAWKFQGNKLERGVAKALEGLGSKPTNELLRAPAYRAIYTKELDRLLGLGIPQATAENAARNYGIDLMGRLLYNTSQRGAFDVAIRNFVPFFPAWKSVMKAWLYEVPEASGGMGLGHALLARKAQLLFDAFKNDGLIKKDPNTGSWEIQATGLNKFFSWALGVKGMKAGISLQSLNMIGHYPGFGPVPSIAISKFVESHPGWQTVFDPLFPYGYSATTGPMQISRVLRGLGIADPFAIFDQKYQQTQFDMSVADVLRTDEFTQRLQATAAMPAGDAKDRATRQVYADAEQKAKSVYLRRGLLGFLVPASPHLYWPNQDEAQKFYDLLKSSGTATAQQFLDAHPELAASLVPKTQRLDGEAFRDQTRNDFFNELRGGKNVATLNDIYGRDTPFIYTGAINYETIRRTEREGLASLGQAPTPAFKPGRVGLEPDHTVTAVDLLTHGYEASQIRLTALKSVELLRTENPTWAKWWDQKLTAAAKKKGLPIPDLQEKYIQQAINTLQVVGGSFADEISGADAKTIKRDAALLGNAFNLEQFFSSDQAPGPEKDLSDYYSKYYIPYWNHIADLRAKYIDKPGATAAEKAQGYLEIQRYRNEQNSPDNQYQFVSAPAPKSVYVADARAQRVTLQAINQWNNEIGANIFTLTTDPTKADITISVGPVPGGYASISANNITLSPVNSAPNKEGHTNALQGWEFAAHELGHAIGLTHASTGLPGVMNGDAGYIGGGEIDAARKLLGVTFTAAPTAEQTSYDRLSPVEQTQAKYRWAQGKMEWMSPFQRTQLGIGDAPNAIKMWDTISQTELSLNNFIRTNNLAPSSKEARGLHDQVNAWEQSLAKYYGLSDEYALSKAPAYARVSALGLISSPAWKRIDQVANSAWAALKASGKGPTSKVGTIIVGRFNTWLGAYRNYDPEVNQLLTEIQNSQSSAQGKASDTWAKSFFFGEFLP